MRRKGGRAKLDAMLRHLGSGHDPQNFPGTRYEQLALIHTACGRGLVEWQEERARYALTPTGSRRLAPRRWLSLASLAAGTAIGATIGAGALAVVWLPGDAAHRTVGPQTIASASLAVPHDPAAGAQPDTPAAPAKVAEQPVPEEPVAKAAPTVIKRAVVKKPRHRTGQGPAWALTNPYPDERYSGFGRIVR